MSDPEKIVFMQTPCHEQVDAIFEASGMRFLTALKIFDFLGAQES